MAGPRSLLEERLTEAFGRIEPGTDPVLRASDHADFQANGALGLAKRLGRNPRELAVEIVAGAELEDLCEQVEVSGPGFINLTLRTELLGPALRQIADSARLGVPRTGKVEVVVVDYSAPNVAKEMHVGHLRSTIIGDALARMLDLAGHDLRLENHIGDWGTPFGMLIEHLLDLGEEKAIHELSVGDLNDFYRGARAAFEADETMRERSRRRVVLLQSGDPETMRLWRILVEQSVHYFSEVYDRLNVLLSEENVVGESFYNPLLPGVVADLDAQGLLVESDGALCVFPPGYLNREGVPLPLIIQKSDGGFGYAATDLAAIRDRVDRLGATRLLYVVGATQAQHLEMCFAVARLAGWLPDDVEATHVSFGNVLDADHKMFKSRAGETVRLVDLLDEAIERAEQAITLRNTDEPGPARRAAAEQVGIGAVKYADLSTDRTKDYVFSWDRMLAFEGDTGPYLQYAHARIASIFRRGGIEPGTLTTTAVITAPAERSLAMVLLGFPDAFEAALGLLAPHRLCAYLYELATTFTTFYESCPILKAEGRERESRLLLSDLTARVLREGLGVLGIAAPDRM